MTKVLHVIYSLELGGGPTHISKLVKDVPVEHYVAGSMGSMYATFAEMLDGDHLFVLSGGFIEKRKQLNKIVSRIHPDIIHVHGRGAAILARSGGIKNKNRRIVYTIHGFHANTMQFHKRVVYKWLEKSLYKNTYAFVHVSRVEMQEFMAFVGGNPAKHLYIPNYIDYREPFRPELPRQGINFLYVGRLSEEKGIDILVEAILQLEAPENVRFYIVGDGPDKVKLKARAAGSRTSISFLGTIDNAVEMMGDFQAVVIPSRKEGLPYVLLEAMYSGVPVICTPEKSISSILSAEYPFKATSFAPKDLAWTLKMFIRSCQESDTLIGEIIQQNLDTVKRDFRKETVLEKLTLLYNAGKATADK